MTNEQAPKRIYMHPTSAEANVNPWPLEPGECVEYVRADLLATVRKEEREAAFKSAIDAARAIETNVESGALTDAVYVNGFKTAQRFIVAALERALTEK